jgi:hypothetical protein
VLTEESDEVAVALPARDRFAFLFVIVTARTEGLVSASIAT